MKKSRHKEENPHPEAGRKQQERPAESILVFLVLAVILLAANVLSGNPYLSPQKGTPVPPETDKHYVWVTGSSARPAGLYLVAPQDMKSSFPDLPEFFAEPSAGAPNPRVTAIHYEDDIPQPAKLPPQVASIFFQPIPINRADADVLTSLPGIGPVLAAKIVQRRNRHGPFRSKDELLHVAGIGPKKLAALADRITLN